MCTWVSGLCNCIINSPQQMGPQRRHPDHSRRGSQVTDVDDSQSERVDDSPGGGGARLVRAQMSGVNCRPQACLWRFIPCLCVRL